MAIISDQTQESNREEHMKRIVVTTTLLLSLGFVAFAAGQAGSRSSATTQNQEASKEAPPDYVPYDQAPEPTKQVTPKYPDLARRAGMEGTVWIRLWVDEMGKVAKAEVTRSDAEIFNEPALNAGKQWLFKPAMSKGKPIAVWVSVPFRFNLTGHPLETRTERALSGSNLGVPELLLIGGILLLFWLVPLVFAVVALVSILRSQFPGPNDKLIWTVVAILVPIIGPILYFIIGTKQRSHAA
jgi:TonB family protein